MSGRKTSPTVAAAKRAVHRSATPGVTPPSPRSTAIQRIDPIQLTKYRDLIRRHLGKLVDKLFSEFTGLNFHIAWAPSGNHEWDLNSLPTGCSVCCRLSGSPLQPVCKTCGSKQLARALGTDGEGHRFTCGLGVRNCWLPVRLRGELLGIAYLQALDHPPPRAKAGNRRVNEPAMVVPPLRFAQAARLLCFVIRHVQMASLADLDQDDLRNAGRIVVALEREQARLHEALHLHLPVTPSAPRPKGPEPHPEQLVHSLLECIASNYSKPITLCGCAAKLGMNPAYLSALFSNAVGVPFKAHLTDLRMAKARELLGSPQINLSEVSAAVGYNSENRFRIAFKKTTGLSPKEWRETMQSTAAPKGC